MLNYLAKFIVGHCPLEEETKVTDVVIADTAEIKAWQEVILSCQTASQLAVCMNLFVGQEDHCMGEVNNKGVLLRVPAS